MSLQLVQAGGSYMQFPLGFVGDGSSTVLRTDSSGHVGMDLDAVLPTSVIADFSSGPSGYTTSVSASLDGSMLTVTFGTAPPAPAGSSLPQAQAVEVIIQILLLYIGV